jgi:hypothetical protein
MNIIYICHDSVHQGIFGTFEDERRIVLGNLGPKINSHIKDMETWIEEVYVG